MEGFFTDVLDRLTNSNFLEAVQSKYHYQKEQLDELKSVAEQLLPLMRREACWNQGEFSTDVPGHWQVCAEGPFREVVLTLGESVDLLQEEFLQEGLFSECYMVEALASEMLLQGYAAYNRNVVEHSEFHVARYYFPGSCDEFPLELLKGVLDRLKMPVRCNEAFCMIPKKSVAFVAELTRDEVRRCQGICVGCNSSNCPNRIEEGMHQSRAITNMADKLLNYGYSKIFGRR